MITPPTIALTLWLALGTSAPATSLPTPLSLEECISSALRQNATLAQKAHRIEALQGRLAEVESIFYPKLRAMSFVSPMYTVKGSALDSNVESRYSSLQDWGPYTHLQALLIQPLTTFGRASAGEKAMEKRIEVERAKLRETEQMIAYEVRKLFYTYLFAVTVEPVIERIKEKLNQAREVARQKREIADGTISQSDLSRLDLGLLEIDSLKLEAQATKALALGALKHTMGLPHTKMTEFKLKRLPRKGPDRSNALPEQLALAAKMRPEWAQLDAGEAALISKKNAEILSMAPTLFLAGSAEIDWSPVREDATNPYHYDPYNTTSGTIAFGLNWNFDPAKNLAEIKGTEAQLKELEDLRRFAQTGIPLQVYQAHQSFEKALKLQKIGKQSVKAARKWMIFGFSAFQTGTGDARDLLEGITAYTKAKYQEYSALYQGFVAEAELIRAIGEPPISNKDIP